MSRPQRGVDWDFTDDWDDPCPLCVQWFEYDDDGDGMPEDAYPYWPDGSVVKRVYRFTHGRCLNATIANGVE